MSDTNSDTSLDELADPRYIPTRNASQDSYGPRAFVTRCLAATDSAGVYLPETLEQAMRCNHAQLWAESMRDEIKSIMDNQTWKLTSLPKDAKIIQGRWVFRTKTDVSGKIIKYKSRWVVRGFQQEDGINFTDTFASVVKPMSYKVLFSIAASQNMGMEQMDVKTAFLNSSISDEVFVEQPHGFEVKSIEEENDLRKYLFSSNSCTPSTSDSGHDDRPFPRSKRSPAPILCKLNKALYGLKQAPRAWYETFSSFLRTLQLYPLHSDYAVFLNPAKSIYVAVYVDDLLIFGKNKTMIQNLKNRLQQKFQMTDLGQAHMYLGMQITRNRKSNIIYVNQQKYLQIILDRFQMSECNPVSTPIETGLKLCKRTDTATLGEIKHYQRLMGCLEYAAMATRPDITFSVHHLAQFASNPDTSHLNAAKRILRYIKGTMAFGLIFRQNSSSDEMHLLGYSDADWAGSIIDRKSIGGYCFYLNNCLISHMSKKQKTVALSTAESETHAAIEATREAIWLRTMLEELGFKQTKPTILHCDNHAAIALSRNPEFHARSKHVDMKYQFLRQHVELGTVHLSFIASEKMAADGFTKPLSRQKHEKFCAYLQGNITE